ncbi:MAG: DUF1080 domain-containing protein [Gemmatimonadota bacterium]
MNRRSTTVLMLAFAGAVLPSPTSAQEWITLFDGSSLDGWTAVGDANWELGDGAVTADSGAGFLVSAESYSDYELRIEFWVDEPANSGIYMRCADPERLTDRTCYEANIFDTRADQTYRTGGLVHIAAPSAVINVGGQWNTYEIRAEGNRVIITLNGTQLVDATDDQLSEGPIGLQYAAGVVRFRNVQIRELD